MIRFVIEFDHFLVLQIFLIQGRKKFRTLKETQQRKSDNIYFSSDWIVEGPNLKVLPQKELIYTEHKQQCRLRKMCNPIFNEFRVIL
jgi:hypothetical protein